MGAVARAVGLDLEKLDAEVATGSAGFKAEIEDNQIAHRLAGHWGVPLMVVQDEPFFGQDRIDLLAWRLAQAGLAHS